jgi:hypothetical protein
MHKSLSGERTGEQNPAGGFKIDNYPKKWYIVNMNFVVTMKRSVLKSIGKLPRNVQDRFRVLTKVLEQEGPTSSCVDELQQTENE